MDDKYLRPVVIGAVIGGVAASMMVMGFQLPHAVAQEEPFHTALSSADQLLPPHPIDVSNLVRIGDEQWSITVDPGVSLNPTSSHIITKIGFGQRKLVQVSTTSSGVYSSEGIVSPYIRYPGVHVKHLNLGESADADSLAYWSSRRGWVASPALTAGSFVVVVPFAGGATVQSNGTTCVLTRLTATC